MKILVGKTRIPEVIHFLVSADREFTVDGEPIEIDDFIELNQGYLSDYDLQVIVDLPVGETFHIKGEEDVFALKRVR